jgi:hypothetical protein
MKDGNESGHVRRHADFPVLLAETGGELMFFGLMEASGRWPDAPSRREGAHSRREDAHSRRENASSRREIASSRREIALSQRKSACESAAWTGKTTKPGQNARLTAVTPSTRNRWSQIANQPTCRGLKAETLAA